MLACKDCTRSATAELTKYCPMKTIRKPIKHKAITVNKCGIDSELPR